MQMVGLSRKSQLCTLSSFAWTSFRRARMRDCGKAHSRD
jgi:hypothetical protein